MLQQTRVDQATPYYERFVDQFPTVDALADSELDQVLRLWEGLGYYARARQLHAAARDVVGRHAGLIPDDYATFRRLPGVGAYTAAAVMSIAHGRPHAVVDGNVIRVLTRLFGIDDDVTRSATRRALSDLADSLLDPDDPGTHNEAMMELGATVCTPAAPDCPHCPLRDICSARLAGNPERYPVKVAAAPIPHHDVAVGIVYRSNGEVLIQRRAEDGLLGGLWEFPGGKQEPDESLEEACKRELEEELGIQVQIEDLFQTVSHAYTHFKVTLHAFRCRLQAGEPVSRAGLPVRWAPLHALEEYAFPRANRRIIERLRDEWCDGLMV